MTNQIVEYDVTEAAIEIMSKEYMPLVITDLNDKEQFDIVHNARMVVKGKRVEVEKKRKELKADALEWGRKVDSEAKRIFGLLEPIETHLQTEEDKVIQEKERIKAEEERREKERIQGRVDALQKVNVILPFVDVAIMSDEEFEAKLAESKEAFEAEQKRLAEEKKAREEEEVKLALERAELAKIREEQERQARIQAEREATLEAERKALEDAKKAEAERKDREAFEAQARENARIQAEKDAKEQVEKEAVEKAQWERAVAEDHARQEALKPDKEKLIAWVKSLREIMIPPLADEEIQTIAAFALGDIYKIADEVEKQLEEI